MLPRPHSREGGESERKGEEGRGGEGKGWGEEGEERETGGKGREGKVFHHFYFTI